MSSRKLIEKLEFESGLLVEMFDACRRIAGDRWLVAFECDSSVNLDRIEAGEDQGLAKALEICRRVFGETVTDTQRRERNFIADAAKEETLRSLLQSFETGRRAYLEHPDFPRRLVLAKAREVLKNPWKFGLTPETLG